MFAQSGQVARPIIATQQRASEFEIRGEQSRQLIHLSSRETGDEFAGKHQRSHGLPTNDTHLVRLAVADEKRAIVIDVDSVQTIHRTFQRIG